MPIEELMRLQLFGGSFGAAIDVPALLAFITCAAIYFIAPVLGYRAERRTGILTALYLLVAYMGLSLVQLLAQLLPSLLIAPGWDDLNLGFSSCTCSHA